VAPNWTTAFADAARPSAPEATTRLEAPLTSAVLHLDPALAADPGVGLRAIPAAGEPVDDALGVAVVSVETARSPSAAECGSRALQPVTRVATVQAWLGGEVVVAHRRLEEFGRRTRAPVHVSCRYVGYADAARTWASDRS
jgi:hypothetical protein